jgi:hypothetical protein
MQDGKVALEHANRFGDGECNSEVVGVLIGAGMAAGQDVNAYLGGRTVLMHACQCGHVESVRALIKKGASLVAVDEVRIPT